MHHIFNAIANPHEYIGDEETCRQRRLALSKWCAEVDRQKEAYGKLTFIHKIVFKIKNKG
jgi:hypothetical protein